MVTGPTFSLTFKNLDQAEQHLRSLSGKPLTTADGLTANVSNQTAAKMASGSAVKKSADIRAHLAAIENFETLFQTGKVIESNPDRAEDLNITAIHRVHSRMEIENTAYNVKFTVKELLHPLTNRIYSIEAMELESAPPAGLLVHDTSRETERGTPLTGGAGRPYRCLRGRSIKKPAPNKGCENEGGNAEVLACTPAGPFRHLARTRPRRPGGSLSAHGRKEQAP